MVLVVDKKAAVKIVGQLKGKHKQRAWIIGEVIKGNREVVFSG